MSKRKEVNTQQALEAVQKLTPEQKQTILNQQVSALLSDLVYRLQHLQEVMGQRIHFKTAITLSETDTRTLFVELPEHSNTLIE